MALSRDRLSFGIKPRLYQYAKALNPTLKEIRLLQFLPLDTAVKGSHRITFSEHEPKIRCHVIEVPLEMGLDFVALSYAWGSSKHKKEIELDGASFNISSNLLQALAQLQADEGSFKRYFWIDAICINQNDTLEKNNQVQMMGEIYRRASRVVVWLGKADADCALAMETIHQIRETNIFTQHGIRNAIAAIDGPNGKEHVHFPRIKSALDDLLSRTKFEAAIGAIEVLISRSWWRRLWVLQEVVLSRHAEIRCGPLAIPWESLEFFLDVCELFMLCHPTHSSFYSVYVITYKAYILSKCWRQVKSGKTSTMFQLFESMITMAVRETTDSRDRVYALLGLAEDAEELGIRPNYSYPPAAVYSHTAKALIMKHGLIILSYCNYHEKDKTRTRELPSWAPDLANTVPDPLRGSPSASIFRASGNTEPNYEFSLSLRTLTIESVIIGKVVTKTIERPNPMASFDSSSMKVLQKWLSSYVHQVSSQLKLDEDALWRTPIANRISKRGQEASRKAQQEDRVGFRELVSGQTFTLLSDRERINDYLYSTWLRTVGRCLFVTTTPFGSPRTYSFPDSGGAAGCIGLASSETRVGDYVCIFLGADVPFIVRDNGMDRCRLIGEAYVHGVMDGEIMRGVPRLGSLYIY